MLRHASHCFSRGDIGLPQRLAIIISNHPDYPYYRRLVDLYSTDCSTGCVMLDIWVWWIRKIVDELAFD